MRFNVGDQVRVTGMRPPDPPPSCPVDWASGMDEYLGQQGRVSSVHETYYVVNFPDGQDWAYLPEWLAPAVDVGDEVAWRLPGWGNADRARRGRVIGVGRDKVVVWPNANACEPLFIKREWLVDEIAVSTEVQDSPR